VQVLAPDGSYRTIPSRNRSWPLAGTRYQQEFTQSWAGLRLSALPTGESRILAYRRIYRGNPWVYSAVNAVAQGVASFPLRVYGWGKDGERLPYRAELPNTPGPLNAAMKLAKLLAYPAPFISRRRTVRRPVVDKMVYGNGLLAKEPDGMGGVASLYNVPWREVSVIAGTEVPVVGFRIMGTAGTRVWALEDAVQFGEGDPDSPISPSPLEPLQWTIALMDAMSRNIVAFFQNGVRSSGVLKLPQMPEDRELAIIREQIQQLYSGNENAGKPLITSGEWSPMSTGFNYSDIVELSRLSREEVATAYRIPPPVMGILDKAIKANVEELREQFLRDVLAPYASEFTDEIDAQLIDPVPQWSGLTSGFDMSGQMLPDLEALAVAFKELKRVFTLNELRRMAGLADLPFEWANQPWMEPGSLPAGLAPQGATLNPDDITDPEADQAMPGDDEVEDGDDAQEEASIARRPTAGRLGPAPVLTERALAAANGNGHTL
jgi:HK97 family phage portal protein